MDFVRSNIFCILSEKLVGRKIAKNNFLRSRVFEAMRRSDYEPRSYQHSGAIVIVKCICSFDLYGSVKRFVLSMSRVWLERLGRVAAINFEIKRGRGRIA